MKRITTVFALTIVSLTLISCAKKSTAETKTAATPRAETVLKPADSTQQENSAPLYQLAAKHGFKIGIPGKN